MMEMLCLQPKVVTDTDDAELAKQLEQLEQDNMEVEGDNDDEDGEEVSSEEDEDTGAKIIA